MERKEDSALIRKVVKSLQICIEEAGGKYKTSRGVNSATVEWRAGGINGHVEIDTNNVNEVGYCGIKISPIYTPGYTQSINNIDLTSRVYHNIEKCLEDIGEITSKSTEIYKQCILKVPLSEEDLKIPEASEEQPKGL